MDWKNTIENIVNKIKQQFFSQRLDGLNDYYILRKEYDPNSCGYLLNDQFEKLLQKLGIFLTTQELRNIYDIYGNKDILDTVNYMKLFQDLKNIYTDRRLQAIRDAFDFLGDGEQLKIPIQHLLDRFKPSNHQRVLTKEKTEQQVYDEFKKAITLKSCDGINIDLNEFIKYYGDINAVLPKEKEQYFQDLIIKTWGLTTGHQYVSQERIDQLETIFFEKVRQHTYTKQNEGKTIGGTFKYYDLSSSGMADLKSFISVLVFYGCEFKRHEILALFNKYDTKNQGKWHYEKLCTIFKQLGRKINE